APKSRHRRSRCARSGCRPGVRESARVVRSSSSSRCPSPGERALIFCHRRKPAYHATRRGTEGASQMDKRIVVVGAGAIGGYTGGNLAHNGFDVTIVDPWPEHVEAIREHGLSLEGVTAEESVVAHPKTLHLTELQHL